MALTSSREELARDAQERQIRAQQEMQAAAQEAATLKELADIQPLAPQQPTRLPIDWQHSADRAAARAANLEQMQLQHQQRLAEMQAREQAERDSLAYKMQMQAKYAPKRTGGGGGAGYMTSLQREYLKLSREVPNDPETKKRWRQSLAAYELAIKKSGKSGVEFLDAVKSGQSIFDVSLGGTKVEIDTALAERKAEYAERLERLRNEAKAKSTEAGASPRDKINAWEAVLKATQNDYGEDVKAKRQEALNQLALLGSSPKPSVPVQSPAPAAPAPSQSGTAPVGNKPSPDAQWSKQKSVWFRRKPDNTFEIWNGNSWSDVGG